MGSGLSIGCFFQAEDGIRYLTVTGVQTCALPIYPTLPRIRMFGYDWPRFHAAVNDLPTALLLVTVLFDLGAWITKRDSLKSAALWTLWAGVIGGWVAELAGLKAEDAIEHGEAIHQLIETHETLALTHMGLFTAG